MSLSDDIASRLRPHQVEPATRLLGILSQHQSAIDISDTGVGKTFVAAAVAKTLQLPTLVICPKIIKSAWHRAAHHFNDELSVINYEALRTGRTTFGQWVGKVAKQSINKCQSCQCVINETSAPCFAHPAGIHCLVPSKTRGRVGRFEFAQEIKMVVGDEAHRFSGLNSENAEMLIAARRQGIKLLLLTATPATSPLGLRAIGYALDLHRLHDYYPWAARHGCRKIPPLPGIRWAVGADKQTTIMKQIRDNIIPARGVRVCRENIPGFPECIINPELYDIENASQIDKIYAEMADSLRALDETAKSDKAPGHPLTEILRARQRIELLKVPIATELISDDVAKNFSSVTFVNFRQTLQELQKRFPEAALIYGGQSQSERDEHIDRFQTNCARVILVMSSAGGVGLGLHDLNGNYPRVANVMPDFSAVNMKQIFGRLPRDGGKSRCYYRVLLAAGTIETRIHRAMVAKMNNIAALNDDDLNPFSNNVMRNWEK